VTFLANIYKFKLNYIFMVECKLWLKKVGDKMLPTEKINFKVKMFAICVLTFSFILLCWVYIVHESQNYKDSMIQSFSTNQEIIVSEVAKSVRGKMEASAAEKDYSAIQSKAQVVEEIIKNAETSGSRYWFFYSSSEVIYEKDDITTKSLIGKDLSGLIHYWKLQGGTGTEAFEALILQESNGSTLFSKSSVSGTEIVSLRSFTIDDVRYFLGMSTQQTYVMSVSRTKEHILYLYLFSGAVSLATMILSLLLCLSIYKHQKEFDRTYTSLTDKNTQIEELTRKLTQKTEAAQNASIYDGLTKLYNRKFFDTLLSRIKDEVFLPVSIVALDINGLSKINATRGFEAGDELLEKTSEILQRVCIDTDVVARTSGSEFTILMTTTDESEAYGTAENIKRQFASLNQAEVTLSMGVAKMLENEQSVFPSVERARKNLTLDKMTDKNSNTYSFISLLMETLFAYSDETVSHCDRLEKRAVKLGKALGLSPSELSRLSIAAQLHDVGKIGIPDNILNKKDILSKYEKELIRRHPELGYQIVKLIPALDEVAVDILQHHEKYDGTGYPAGLVGEQITLNARIIAVVDSFDIMINTCVYATTKTVEEAVHELRKYSNRQFDPHIVNAFIKEFGNEHPVSSEIA